MSTSKWQKRWLYDSKVEIPKTTKWRLSSEFIEPAVYDDFRHRDVRQDLSSETIDLGNNNCHQRQLTWETIFHRLKSRGF